MRVRLIATLTAALVAGGIALTSGPAAAAPAAPAATTTAAGTIVSHIHRALPNGDTFIGKFTPKHFSSSNGRLLVTGVVTGAVTGSTAPTGAITPQRVTTTVSRAATAGATADQATASCTILDLVLGPLHLNLLGLVVDLNRVHLVITAVPGPGNLLGNLLCAIANLLNGTSLGSLAGVLNSILALLGG